MNTVVEKYRMALAEHLDTHLEAAFIYGSVARGTAGPDSDIDALVMTRTELPPEQLAEVRRICASLQRQLGYRPDAHSPVEVFSVEQCLCALRGVLVLRAVYCAAIGRDIDTMTLETDDLEILRAMLDVRMPIVESPLLDSLTRLATDHVGAIAADHGVTVQDLIARLWLPKSTVEGSR